jgi:hypothetical protein
LIAKLVNDILNEEEFRYFKGPSREKILIALKGKTLKEKFRLAIQNNIIWLVEDCIDKGIDPTFSDNWPIRFAAHENNVELLKLLIKDKRTDPSDLGNIAIQWAFFNVSVDTIKFLLKDKRVRDKIDPNDYRFKKYL